MEQSAVFCSGQLDLSALSIPCIRQKLKALGPRPVLSDLGVSDALNGEHKALSVTPGREYWRPTLNNTRPAGVLVPLVDRPDGLNLLLTRRTDHLKDHAGQISFPGGGYEQHDTSIVATALRETNEEIGVAEDRVTVLGTLPKYVTISAYAITPVVGVIVPPYDMRLDPNEVADAFEVPLAHVLNPANHQRHFREEKGVRRGFYAIPYGDRLIWGATAGILVNFSRMLGEDD